MHSELDTDAAKQIMNDYAKQVRDSINESGFHVTFVGSGDRPAFCYSTGVFETFSIPELFISSLPPGLSHELITQYVDRHANHQPPPERRISAIDERFDLSLIHI